MAIFRPLVGVPTKNQCSLRSQDDFGLFPDNRKHRASESKLQTGSQGSPGRGRSALGRVGHNDR